MAVERALGALIPLMPFIFVIFIIWLDLRENRPEREITLSCRKS